MLQKTYVYTKVLYYYTIQSCLTNYNIPTGLKFQFELNDRLYFIKADDDTWKQTFNNCFLNLKL